MKENKACLSDCNVTELILKYLVPIFQYLSIEMKDYNMMFCINATKHISNRTYVIYRNKSE